MPNKLTQAGVELHELVIRNPETLRLKDAVGSCTTGKAWRRAWQQDFGRVLACAAANCCFRFEPRHFLFACQKSFSLLFTEKRGNTSHRYPPSFGFCIVLSSYCSIFSTVAVSDGLLTRRDNN